MVSDRPRLLVEVLAGSTERIDRFVKLDEYKSLVSVDYILIVAPLRCDVGFWFRNAGRAWRSRVLRDPAAVLHMPSLGLQISVASQYVGLQLQGQARPRLTEVETPPQ